MKRRMKRKMKRKRTRRRTMKRAMKATAGRAGRSGGENQKPRHISNYLLRGNVFARPDLAFM